MNDRRSYMAGHFALDLDRNFSGWLFSAEGGSGSAEVVTEKFGPDRYPRKHVGGIKYDELTFSCGLAMNQFFYKWIQKAINDQSERIDGAIVIANYDYIEQARLTWYGGMISEVGFPALDAGAKDPARLTVKVAPERTEMKKVQNGMNLSNYAPIRNYVKNWHTSNFRLRIRGLEQGCSRVNKIEALVLKQKTIESPFNTARDWEREAATVEVPNLVFTLPESHAEQFYKWYEDFVIRGKNDQDHEKEGTLEFLSSNLKDVLFTINLHQLGIFKLTADKLESGAESLRRVKVEMYMEQLSVDWDTKIAAV